MQFLSINNIIFLPFLELTSLAFAHPTFTNPPSYHLSSSGSQTDNKYSDAHARPYATSAQYPPAVNDDPMISLSLFHSLEELARLVDISYCVGTSGISKPFQCASRCDDFPGYELVNTFNTGVAKSDSSGYIVLDHGLQSQGDGKQKGRIITAFRGTYSIANTIVDLSTVPQEYIPYPEDPENPDTSTEILEASTVQRFINRIPLPWPLKWKHTFGTRKSKHNSDTMETRCTNCTVHTGFYTSWLNTRPYVVPHLNLLKHKYPEYQLHLVGHSLGGAVAALAALELEGNGWRTIVTTFGEPMIGNQGLRRFLDGAFGLDEEDHADKKRYRRVTHTGDPVPLLPLREWGYRSHAGEIYIGKGDLQPEVLDLRLCYGDEDANCIAGSDDDNIWFQGDDLSSVIPIDFLDKIRIGKWGAVERQETAWQEEEKVKSLQKRWPKLPIPTRYKLWQLFFAHRDYFWRLGVCLPGGDPLDWRRPHYNLTELENRQGIEEL